MDVEIKVIYPKYSKHWLSTVAHTIDCVCNKIMVQIMGYTGGKNVWGDRPFYLVKQPQEKWACDFHDDALPLSFQLQVAEVIF